MGAATASGNTPAIDSLVGVRLGEAYEITRLMGQGGMGAIYEAKHLRLPRRFAS